MRQALGPGALGKHRGSGWRGRWEGGSGWGTHVNPWLFHFNVWQNPLQIKKKIKKKRKKKKEKKECPTLCCQWRFLPGLIIINIFKHWLPVNEFPHPETIPLIDICWHPQWGKKSRCQKLSELLASGRTDPLTLPVLTCPKATLSRIQLLSPSLSFLGLCSPSSTWSIFPLLLFSHSVVSDSLWPHGLQHTRLPCPSLSPGACSNSCPLSRWCHPIISSSGVPFSSCLQSFPSSEPFLMSRLFSLGKAYYQPLRRKWQPTPVLLPGKSRGWRSLVG